MVFGWYKGRLVSCQDLPNTCFICLILDHTFGIYVKLFCFFVMAAMVSDNDEQFFKCRSSSSSKALKSNRNRHEKKKGHVPQQRLNNKTPVFDEGTKLFVCPSAGCKTTSKFNYIQIMVVNYKKRREQTENNKVCNFCGMVFVNRHVRKQHASDIDD